jgi:hypothetical protein
VLSQFQVHYSAQPFAKMIEQGTRGHSVICKMAEQRWALGAAHDLVWEACGQEMARSLGTEAHGSVACSRLARSVVGPLGLGDGPVDHHPR